VASIEIMLLSRSSKVLVIISCFQSLCINLQDRELEGGVEGLIQLHSRVGRKKWVEWFGCVGCDHFVLSKLSGLHFQSFAGGAVAVVGIGDVVVSF